MCLSSVPLYVLRLPVLEIEYKLDDLDDATDHIMNPWPRKIDEVVSLGC